MLSNKLLILCLWYFASITTGDALYFVEPCTADQPSCKLAFQVVYSHVNDIDPMTLSEVKISADGLELFLHDIHITGISKCNLLQVERDDGNELVNINAECPLEIVGKYESSGKVGGILNVEGNSDFRIQTDNILIKTKNQLKKTNGKYWTITNKDIKYEIKERVHLKFNKLFNGDVEKAKPVQDFIDANWKDMVTTLGTPVFEEGIKQLIHHVNNYLHGSADQ